MTGHSHDLEKVVPCFPKIVQSTVTEIVEGEILYFRFLACGLKAMFDFVKGLSISKE